MDTTSFNSVREEFESYYRENISRPGADKLLAWLVTTDFFTAPASTRYHLAVEGGLCRHSINVFLRLRALYQAEITHGAPLTREQLETVAICGLLHDVCKTNTYKIELRNRKNDQGVWEQVPFYTVDDRIPYGHGEKSVYIISGFLKLSREEAMAIRWHMGFTDNDFRAGSHTVGQAMEQFPLALLCHIADLESTYLDEAR